MRTYDKKLYDEEAWGEEPKKSSLEVDPDSLYGERKWLSDFPEPSTIKETWF